MHIVITLLFIYNTFSAFCKKKTKQKKNSKICIFHLCFLFKIYTIILFIYAFNFTYSQSTSSQFNEEHAILPLNIFFYMHNSFAGQVLYY